MYRQHLSEAGYLKKTWDLKTVETSVLVILCSQEISRKFRFI